MLFSSLSLQEFDMQSDIQSSFEAQIRQSTIGPSSSVSQLLPDTTSEATPTEITILSSSQVPVIPSTLEQVPGNKRYRRVVLYPTNTELHKDFFSWWNETSSAKDCAAKEIKPKWSGGRADVWDYFTQVAAVPSGEPLVRCSTPGCGVLFVHPNFPKRNGTTNLLHHVEKHEGSQGGHRSEGSLRQYLIAKVCVLISHC
jgi:hypothetical protein